MSSRYRRLAWQTSSVLALTAGLTAARGVRQAQPEIFVDVAAKRGLDFTYKPDAKGALHLPEVMGPGAALFDVDNDGDLDVYLVQGGRLGPKGEPLPAVERDRLYRNDLRLGPGGARDLTFTDVSSAYGLVPGGYAMGAASGDFDNDGWTDVLVTGYGSIRLLRNVAGRRLVDVTTQAGLRDSGWSVSAAWIDYDRDGWLDLFLARYVQYAPVTCVLPSGRRDYCGPKSFTPQPDRLFHNVRGRFQDVSATHLSGVSPAPGLGVIAGDFNDDGFVDLYVANDGTANHLWWNQQGRRFKEDGLLGGVALNINGLAEAGMGTDAGDVDDDGDLDLFVTNLTGETNTLYLNNQKGLFDDRTLMSGLGPPSLPMTGFGTCFFDYDNDGHLDIAVVNGGVHVTDKTPTPATPRSIGQPPLLFRGAGNARFVDVTAQAGRVMQTAQASRGLSVGDIDNDGDPDLLVANSESPAQLLLNSVGQRSRWLGLRLVTGAKPRDAHGAVVWLRRRGATALLRHAHPDGSYASSSDPRVLFGLGDATVEAIDVRWPDGTRERFGSPATGEYTTLRQGSGQAVRRDGQR